MQKRLSRWLRFNWMYFRRPPWDTGVTPPELHKFIRSHPPGKALDLGCGTGTNLVSLGRANWSVVGVDFALKAVAEARNKLRRSGLAGRVIQGDVTRVSLPEAPFNLVLDIGCYHGLPGEARLEYRTKLLNILAVRGTFLIYLHLNHDQPIGWGVSEDEISMISQFLVLKTRTDSHDRFGRQAAWLEFERNP
jgi:SAM-dependent methyltransferase